ncbi:MAG: CoA-binding protein [Flavobacteriaceae bacterium]|nr:CoA-binding protein [Bacteroidia bacterium]NNK87020.1 CoA-binding protein [Flavobacteriaceae bacterium]
MALTTLVFGASLKAHRASHLIIERLLNNGHKAVAFGLLAGSISGIEVSSALKPYQNIDTISLYISPKWQSDYYAYLMGLNPRRVIFNPGTENPEFYKLLQRNGIAVDVACSLVLLATNQY